MSITYKSDRTGATIPLEDLDTLSLVLYYWDSTLKDRVALRVKKEWHLSTDENVLYVEALATLRANLKTSVQNFIKTVKE